MKNPPDLSPDAPRDTTVLLRAPVLDDAAAMWRAAQAGLDINSPYSYLMLAEHFADTCAVALPTVSGGPGSGEPDSGDVAGFVTGFCPPAAPDTLFIWQIAVAPTHRRQGLGVGMLDHLVDRPRQRPLRFLDATVTPTNEASARMFEHFAVARGAPFEWQPLFEREHFPDPAAHEPERRVRIGPFRDVTM